MYGAFTSCSSPSHPTPQQSKTTYIGRFSSVTGALTHIIRICRKRLLQPNRRGQHQPTYRGGFHNMQFRQLPIPSQDVCPAVDNPREQYHRTFAHHELRTLQFRALGQQPAGIHHGAFRDSHQPRFTHNKEVTYVKRENKSHIGLAGGPFAQSVWFDDRGTTAGRRPDRIRAFRRAVTLCHGIGYLQFGQRYRRTAADTSHRRAEAGTSADERRRTRQYPTNNAEFKR